MIADEELIGAGVGSSPDTNTNTDKITKPNMAKEGIELSPAILD